jgi:hypothetical protein
VLVEHSAYVHAIDVVAAEDGHQQSPRTIDEIQILKDRVSRPPISNLIGRAHLSRHWNDKLVLQHSSELPALPKMAHERVAVCLHENIDGIDSRIDEIAEDEIDYPILPTERHGRFRPHGCE